MRKFIAILTGITLVLLCGCGEGISALATGIAIAEPETTAFVPATIAYIPPTTAPWEPNDLPAIMEPFQGGPMLYKFMAREPYKYTKETSDGGSEYDNPHYYYGLVNQNGELVAAPQYDSYPYYFYDETGRAMGMLVYNDQGYYTYSLDGKRTKIDTTCTEVRVVPGGRYAIIDTAEKNAERVVRKGLYDLLEQKYIIEPEDGLDIRYNGAVIGGDWYFNQRDGSLHEVPSVPGRISEYYPEVGWFRTGDQYFDNEWNEYPWELARYYVEPNRELWIDTGYDKRILCNRKGNIIYAPSEGERLEELRPLGSYAYREPDAFLVLDAGGNVTRIFASNGTSWQPSDGIYQNKMHDESMVFRLKDGKWQAIDFYSFNTPPGYSASALRANDDYIIIVFWESEGCTTDDVFAIDWDGNKIENSPLKPFFFYLGMYEEQGDYYWIEKDGRRGYINTSGAWLFIDSTEYNEPS